MRPSIRLILFFCFIVPVSWQAAVGTQLRACFTPNEDCTTQIVAAIDNAKSELLVQAYGFTSVPIIQAVVRAKERGVNVRIILDKVNTRKQYTAATYLINHGIDALIDFEPAIAHSKVMIIDRQNVITGSFNFTTAAQRRNAENVLFILDDIGMANVFVENWEQRSNRSKPYSGFHGPIIMGNENAEH